MLTRTTDETGVNYLRWSKLFEVLPLVSRNKDIQGHKRASYFAGVENESELILARAGIFT